MNNELPKDIGETFMFQSQFGTQMVYRRGITLNTPIRSLEVFNSGIIKDKEFDKAVRDSLQTIEPIGDEWLMFIKDQDWYHETKGKLDPDREILRDKLLSFAGEEVCMMGGEDDETLSILHCGQFWTGIDAIMKEGQPSQCHLNSFNLWAEDRKMMSHIIYLCTGYALSDDGMWRRHSWCIRKSINTIIETTEPRILYYGYVLNDIQAMGWAF